jgi:2-aminoadipate transaminase
VVAAPPVLEKVVLGKGAADLCTSTLTQFFVRQYFAEGGWKDYVEDLLGLYSGRRDTMLAALAEHFPAAATWTEPEGGLFIWATLPDYIDTEDLLAKALRSDVAFVPGKAAYVDGRGAHSMRLNFSGVNSEEIREGIMRIGRVIREQVELYETLAPGQASAEVSPGTPGREAEDVPAEADRRAADQGPHEADEGADVLPFRKASGQ